VCANGRSTVLRPAKQSSGSVGETIPASVCRKFSFQRDDTQSELRNCIGERFSLFALALAQCLVTHDRLTQFNDGRIISETTDSVKH
jgi:hypothetical protein